MRKLYRILFILFFSIGLSDQPDWSINPSDFQFNASMTGVLIFNGEESTDSNDIIAAFVGDECRGVKTEGILISGRLIFGLTIFGHENGESLTFKAYDASTDHVFDSTGYFYNFVPNDIVGSAQVPVEWDFVNPNLSSEVEALPHNFVLYPAYPNPFNPVLNIPLTLDKPGEISVFVVDINGHIVDTIFHIFGGSGNYTLTWNGNQFPSGVYFISFNSKRGVAGQKVLLLK